MNKYYFCSPKPTVKISDLPGYWVCGGKSVGYILIALTLGISKNARKRPKINKCFSKFAFAETFNFKIV